MKLVAKTLYGLERVLQDELLSLGASDVKTGNRAVFFNGNLELLYRANYCLRTALSVLMPVSEFRIRSKDDLYKAASRIDWDRYMDKDGTFSVVPVVKSSLFTHTGYAGLIVKDAIADHFRDKYGRRPSVDTTTPDILVNLHISNEQVTVSLDSSVVPLFKRGYRQEQSLAPLNEVLAAGIVMLSGWDASTSFIDPMCGSGTLPIEACMIAKNIPAGFHRQFFGFQKWENFNEELFDRIKSGCADMIISSPVKISCSDISPEMVFAAAKNIAFAGMSDDISIDKADFKDLRSSGEDLFIFLNPPYGERIQPEEIESLYRMIGSNLKHNYTGSTAMLITSNMEALKFIGLKAKEKYTLYNGSLECLLMKYELYQGTRKQISAEVTI
jgi:putative N6-adenine-specific DNA methylase